MKTSIVGFLKVFIMSMILVPTAVLPIYANDKAATKQEVKVENTININTANADELLKLPRIGPVMAKRIVEFRDEHGKFNTPEELMNVRGIGAKTFERLKAHISI